MPPMHRLATFASLLALAACRGAPSPAEPAAATNEDDTNSRAIAAARAFQADYEQQLRADPRSFLTVIESHYLAVGETLTLGERRFEATPEAMLVHGSEGEQRFVERGLIEAGDGRLAWSCSRQEQDWRVLVHDAEAPTRTHFDGIAWFPIDASWIVQARFEAASVREPMVVQTSRGVTKTLYLAGQALFEHGGQTVRLQVFGYAAAPTPDEPLLIPFRDQTSGRASYAAGRYLEPTLPATDQLLLDFNRATNPLCAYSEHYNCPMPPRANHLRVAVTAGAMAPAAH
jgi:hypothetical protein